MKFSLAASLTLTMLAGLAAARECYGGYDYCGKTMNKISDKHIYQDNMEGACQKVGKNCTGEMVNEHLFACLMKRKGNEIIYIKECEKGCKDKGMGKDDKCEGD